ncbi:MAG TPA: hypothetical protein DCY35_00055, partial [Prolixibacteraceae bacterium]|nr:hypothetical protein [Prolixibacteraceae bacterium]
MKNKIQEFDYKPFTKHTFLLFFLIIIIHTGIFSQNTTDKSEQADDLYWMAIDTARLSNEYEVALELLQKSLKVSQEVFGVKNHRFGRIYTAIGNQYKNLYQVENAYRSYRIAEEMYLLDSLNNSIGLAGLYSNLGSYFRGQGNYAEAIRYNLRSLDLYNQLFERNLLVSPAQQRNRFFAALNLTNSYYESDHLEEAVQVIQQYSKQADPEVRTMLESNLALIYSDQGKFKEVTSIIKYLISTFTKRYGANDYTVADQYIILGKVLIQQDLQDSALIYLKKAKDIYSQYDNVKEYIVQIDRLYADAWMTMKVNTQNDLEFRKQRINNLKEAAKYYLLCLNRLNDNITPGLISSDTLIKSKYQIINLQIIRQLSRTWTQIGRLTIEEPGDRKVYYEYAMNA